MSSSRIANSTFGNWVDEAFRATIRRGIEMIDSPPRRTIAPSAIKEWEGCYPEGLGITCLRDCQGRDGRERLQLVILPRARNCFRSLLETGKIDSNTRSYVELLPSYFGST